MPTRHAALLHYVLGALAAVILLNLGVRGLLRVGGFTATLLVALLTAGGLRLLFQWRQQRAPNGAEIIRLSMGYALGLGALYLGLYLLMWLQDAPGHMGQLLFLLHYLIYPACMGILLRAGHR